MKFSGVKRGVYEDNFDTNFAMVTLFARLLSNFLLGSLREWLPFTKFAKNLQFSASYNLFVFGLIAIFFRYFPSSEHSLKSYVLCFWNFVK